MIERNLCSKEQALKLYQLGVAQKGCWCFVLKPEQGEEPLYEKDPAQSWESMYTLGTRADAWTAQELKLLIGDRFRHPKMAQPKPVRTDKGFENKGSMEWEVYLLKGMKSFKNEACACAFFLITILEEQAITLEEVNERATLFFGEKSY